MKSLNANGVEYLLIGGQAVAYHGYPRPTGDMDVWIAVAPENAARVVKALQQFGFGSPGLVPDLFLKPNQIIRMGVPPFRIEISTSISGVGFDECYAQRVVDKIDGVEASLINLRHLRINKLAAGRHKDLNDLEHLPGGG